MMGRRLERGSNGEADTTRLSEFLTGLAVGTNETYVAKALDFRAHREKLAVVLKAFDRPDKPNATVATERDRPMADSDASERQNEVTQARGDWQQHEAVEKAAEPTNDLDRFDN